MAHSPMDGGGNGNECMDNETDEQIMESGYSPGEGWEFIGINDQGYWIWKKIIYAL
jgi:hypothetical protein